MKKITETIERNCCEPQDLKPYEGTKDKDCHYKAKFCMHCGQIWIWDRKPGEMDYGWDKVPLLGD